MLELTHVGVEDTSAGRRGKEVSGGEEERGSDARSGRFRTNEAS